MQGCSLSDVGLMSEVSIYNEVDCRVVMEAVGHLRDRVRPQRQVRCSYFNRLAAEAAPGSRPSREVRQVRANVRL